MTEQTFVSSNGPEKAKYLARMEVKFQQGLQNVKHTFNFEGLAERFGGEALYIEYGGLPPLMANGVRFPDQETHDRAWESVYAELNAIEDEMESGNFMVLEFGDSHNPNEPYLTESAKIAHSMLHRKTGGPLSIHDAELVEKGIIGQFRPTRVTDVDNYTPPSS